MLFLDRAHALFVFFFNDTATTGSYTYGHPLSLHYALPISVYSSRHVCLYRVNDLFAYLAAQRTGISGRFVAYAVTNAQAIVDAFCGNITTLNRAARSEEHTSELQSLMRISYAVFCLKKNKQLKATTLQYPENLIISM